jgi:hypothetical protein
MVDYRRHRHRLLHARIDNRCRFASDFALYFGNSDNSNGQPTWLLHYFDREMATDSFSSLTPDWAKVVIARRRADRLAAL